MFTILLPVLSFAQHEEAIEKCLKELKEYPNDDSIQIGANGMLASLYLDRDVDSAIYFADICLSHTKKNTNPKYKAYGYHQVGHSYNGAGRTSEALNFFNKALVLAEKSEDLMSLIGINNSIGLTHYYAGNIEEATKYYEDAIKISKELNDTSVMTTMLNNVGGIYYRKGNHKLALKSFEEAIKLTLEQGNEKGAAGYMANAAMAYGALKQYPKSIELLQKGISLMEENTDQYMSTLQAFSRIYEGIGNYYKAIDYRNQALKMSLRSNNVKAIRDNYESLYIVYEKQGNIEQAYIYKNKFLAIKDSLDQLSSKEEIATIQAKFENERKEKTIQLLEKENKLNELESERNKTITYAITAGGTLLLVLLLISFRAYRQKQKSNKILEEQNQLINSQKEAINTQKELVEEINKEMVDSITYAQRIQNAILPTDEFLQQALPNSFVFFKPKDIVSGDFYVVEKVKNKTLFGVVDCTGHGVPGALMSIVGHNGLSKATSEYGLQSPAKILDFLHQNLSETFSKGRTKNIRDGMDVALCSIDFSTYELEFAGAMNPLYVISEGEIKEVKGDKMAIGSENREDKYTNHKIRLKKGDSVFVFSDGYADQFGGEKGKKLKYQPFRDLLLEINNADSQEQKKSLETYFKKWKGDFQQIDDVCIIGVKL